MKKIICKLVTLMVLGFMLNFNLNAIGSLKDDFNFDYLDRSTLTVIRMKAVAGNHKSQFLLGVLYYLEDKHMEAFEWFKMSADSGYNAAQHAVGKLYIERQGVPFNLRESFKYFLMAANQNFVLSQRLVGKMYIQGFGVPVNIEEGIKWLKVASINKDPIAPMILGAIYYNGEQVPKDIRQSNIYFVKAAQNGNEQAFDALKNLHFASLYKRTFSFIW